MAYELLVVGRTLSLLASSETLSPNFERHTRASYILPVVSGDSEKLRTAIFAADHIVGVSCCWLGAFK